MQYLQLPTFNGLAQGQRATAQIPSYKLSLGRIILKIGGANLSKATISEIVIKIGSRVVFGPISGTALDKLNKYRGQFDQANHLTIDLTERDGLSIGAKEIGAIDIPGLRGEPIFIEVMNNAAGADVKLSGVVGYTGRQMTPDKDGKYGREEQLIHKILRYQVPTAGGTRQVWMPNFRGAILKRIHFEYTGTDWTASANGNLYQVECRKNGVAIHDRIECLTNRFIQQEHGKVPQSKLYTVDFVHDNVHSSALNTRDARSLEFNIDVTAADTITAYAEVLDLPNNL